MICLISDHYSVMHSASELDSPEYIAVVEANR
jgi:hypothetical protein